MNRLLPLFLGSILFLGKTAYADPDEGPISTNASIFADEDIDLIAQDRPPAARLSGHIMARPVALLFAGFDRNGDRKIDRMELTSSISAEWASLEKSLSGNVSALAFKSWQISALGSEEALPSRVSFDTDLDTTISESEFTSTLTSLFDEMDSNKDGVVDRAEMTFTAPRANPRADELRRSAEERRRQREAEDRRIPRRVTRF